MGISSKNMDEITCFRKATFILGGKIVDLYNITLTYF